MTPGKFNDLLSRLVDRDLSADEMAELDAWLLESPEARREYLDFIANDQLLGAMLAPSARSSTSRQRVISMRDVLRLRRLRELKVAAAVAAAVLLLGVVALQLMTVDQSPDYALDVELAPDSEYLIEHSVDGQTVEGRDKTMRIGSRMRLSQGVVRLGFESGVAAVVQAPADITLQSETVLVLNEGTGWFRVEDGAEGFTVVTPELKVVDLGTEFGVVSSLASGDQVHVFEGMVEVSWLDGGGVPAVLKQGQARELMSGWCLDECDLSPERFLKALPDYVPYLHWAFDSRDGHVDLSVQGTHAAAGFLETGFRVQGDANAFEPCTGIFGGALQSKGRGGFIDTDWQGVAGDAPRTIAYWVKLSPEHTYLHPVVGWGNRQMDGALADDTDNAATGSFYSFVESLDRQPDQTVAGMSFGGFWVKGRRNINDGNWHHVAQVFTGKYLSNGTPQVIQYVDGWIDRTESFYHDHWLGEKIERIPVNTRTRDAKSVPMGMMSNLFSTDGPGMGAPIALDEVYVFEGAINTLRVDELMEKNQVGGE